MSVTARNDFTAAHDGKLYQVVDPVNTKSVVVEEKVCLCVARRQVNGTMVVQHNGKALRFKEIKARPERPKRPFTYKPSKKYIPPKDHPWREYPLTLKEDICICSHCCPINS